MIATLAPIACIVAGYVIWRFVLGNASNFTNPDPNGGFWPAHKGPLGTFTKMYEGGIVVPILIGSLLIVLTFVIERLLTIKKAAGAGNIAEFIRQVQFHLANKDVDKALAAELVEGLEGVSSVENKLMVKNDGKGNTDPKHTSALKDAKIATVVKTSLLFEPETSGTSIDVDVSNSVVTLSGVVDSDAEKDLAVAKAKNTKDVVNVVDKLTVSKG